MSDAAPHNRRAERAVLGSMLQSKEQIPRVQAMLPDGAAEFYFEAHAALYDVVVSLDVLDGLIVERACRERGVWEKVGEYQMLADLFNSVPSTANADHYAGLVHSAYLQRRFLYATNRAASAAREPEWHDTMSNLRDEIDAIMRGVVARREQSFADTVDAMLITASQARELGMVSGIPSGFGDLDDILCGFQPDEFTIVGGRTGMGKTAMLVNLAEHMAIDAKAPVLLFSLEMSEAQIVNRMVCSRANVDSRKMRRGGITDADLANIERVVAEIRAAPIHIVDAGSQTVATIRAKTHDEVALHGIRAVLVDYVQLMRPARKHDRRDLEIGEFSRGLKALAMELHIPVIGGAQLNRSVETDGHKPRRPRLSDLRESGSLEQDADNVVLLHRPSYYWTPEERATAAEAGQVDRYRVGDTDVLVAKQRNGPTGDCRLWYDPGRARFSSTAFDGKPDTANPFYDAL